MAVLSPIPDIEKKVNPEWCASRTFFESGSHHRIVEDIGAFFGIGGHHLRPGDSSVLVHEGNYPASQERTFDFRGIFGRKAWFRNKIRGITANLLSLTQALAVHCENQQNDCCHDKKAIASSHAKS
jgi:hypothetical protein